MTPMQAKEKHLEFVQRERRANIDKLSNTINQRLIENPKGTLVSVYSYPTTFPQHLSPSIRRGILEAIASKLEAEGWYCEVLERDSGPELSVKDAPPPLAWWQKLWLKITGN